MWAEVRTEASWTVRQDNFDSTAIFSWSDDDDLAVDEWGRLEAKMRDVLSRDE